MRRLLGAGMMCLSPRLCTFGFFLKGCTSELVQNRLVHGPLRGLFSLNLELPSSLKHLFLVYMVVSSPGISPNMECILTTKAFPCMGDSSRNCSDVTMA